MDVTPAKWIYGKDIVFTTPARHVDTIFLHCSASDVAAHDDISVMRRWHMVDNKWSRVGYHFFINKNGNIQDGCPIEQEPIAQKGYNTGSIAICVHGLELSKFTAAQMTSVKKLCQAITDAYDTKIRIRGHKEVSAKACPVFDYKATLRLNAEGYYSNDAAVKTGVVSAVAKSGSQVAKAQVPVTKRINPIELMSKGSHVMALQKLLTRFGFNCAIDGSYGQNTATQVKAFQRKHGLVADGIVGGQVIAAMFSGKNIVIKKPQSGIDVEVLQLLLAVLGESIMHDGVFGGGTEIALKKQQKLFGLNGDGVFGPGSQKKMLS